MLTSGAIMQLILYINELELTNFDTFVFAMRALKETDMIALVGYQLCLPNLLNGFVNRAKYSIETDGINMVRPSCTTQFCKNS